MKSRPIPEKIKRRNVRGKPGSKGVDGSRLIDFSAVEDDVNAFQLIRRLANNAGICAEAEARAHGLGIAYARGNKIVKVFANGEVIDIVPKSNRASFYIKYNPATILHPVKK